MRHGRLLVVCWMLLCAACTPQDRFGAREVTFAELSGWSQDQHTEALAGGLKNFRLPGGYESDRYRLKLAGTGRFRELRVAQSFRELSSL